MSLPSPDRAPVRALVFDVFGTVVDWRGSIIREGEAHLEMPVGGSCAGCSPIAAHAEVVACSVRGGARPQITP